MPPAHDLKPRTVGELLDGAFHVYRRLFGRLLIVSTIVSVPTLILAALYAGTAADVMREYVETTLLSAVDNAEDPVKHLSVVMDQVVEISILGLVQSLLQSLSRGAAVATMAFVAWRVVRRLPVPRATSVVREVLPRIPAVVLADFSITYFFGIVWCCPPLGVVFFVLLTAVPAVAVLERGRIETDVRGRIGQTSGAWRLLLRGFFLPAAIALDACIRSVSLTWHGATIGRGTLFTFFLYLFVTLFVGGITATLWWALEGNLEDSGPTLFWAQHYAEVVFLPIRGLGIALWYLDLRVRREGLDVTMASSSAPRPA